MAGKILTRDLERKYAAYVKLDSRKQVTRQEFSIYMVDPKHSISFENIDQK